MLQQLNTGYQSPNVEVVSGSESGCWQNRNRLETEVPGNPFSVNWIQQRMQESAVDSGCKLHPVLVAAAVVAPSKSFERKPLQLVKPIPLPVHRDNFCCRRMMMGREEHGE